MLINLRIGYNHFELDQALLGLGHVLHSLEISSALDVHQLALGVGRIDFDGDQGGVVLVLTAKLAGVGKVFGGNTAIVREVGDVKRLFVSGIPALTVDPDVVLVGLVFPVRLQACRPVLVLLQIEITLWDSIYKNLNSLKVGSA